MLPTKPLTDVLKSATEVTSLSATDRVQIVDANGVPKRISKSNIDKNNVAYFLPENAGEGKWIRVANIISRSIGLLFVTNGWNTTVNTPAIFMVAGGHYNGMYRASVSALLKSALWPKARFVYKANEAAYLDLFVKTLSTTDQIQIEKIGGFISLNTEYTEGNVPNGYSVMEFDLFSGGG